MQSNRALLWVVLVGLVLVISAYYLGASRNATPLPAPTGPSVTEAPAPPTPVARPAVDSAEPSPADLTAAEAAQTVKRVEQEQQQQMQMMEKTALPVDGEWVDGPGEQSLEKPATGMNQP